MKSRPLKNVQIFTDGSYKDGKGTWSFLIVQGENIIFESAGVIKNTTCNRAEFQAVIEALRWLPERSQAILYADSRVVIDAVTLHMSDWRALGWRKKNGRPIPDVDLIQILFELLQARSIQWNWIRAHSGNFFNERCDALCLQARENQFPFSPNVTA